MIKVRVQGTKREIRWFLKLLERDKRFRLENTSTFFNNKGTDRYKRLYTEVHRTQDEKEISPKKRNRRTSEHRNTGIACASGRVFGSYEKVTN